MKKNILFLMILSTVSLNLFSEVSEEITVVEPSIHMDEFALDGGWQDNQVDNVEQEEFSQNQQQIYSNYSKKEDTSLNKKILQEAQKKGKSEIILNLVDKEKIDKKEALNALAGMIEKVKHQPEAVFHFDAFQRFCTNQGIPLKDTLSKEAIESAQWYTLWHENNFNPQLFEKTLEINEECISENVLTQFVDQVTDHPDNNKLKKIEKLIDTRQQSCKACS